MKASVENLPAEFLQIILILFLFLNTCIISSFALMMLKIWFLYRQKNYNL